MIENPAQMALLRWGWGSTPFSRTFAWQGADDASLVRIREWDCVQLGWINISVRGYRDNAANPCIYIIQGYTDRPVA